MKGSKPQIGLLGIMQELYDDMIPGITEHQEGYAREIVKQLSDEVELIFPRAARNRQDIEEIVKGFNSNNLDGIMIVMLTYGPGQRIVRALQMNRLPLLLANIQPVPSVTDQWNMDDLTYNQGIHGAQDTANAILRTYQKPCTIISEDWRSEAFKAYVADWAKAAQTVNELRKMKVAIFGRMEGMGDITTDDSAFLRKIGPQVCYEDIGQVYRNMENVSQQEIDEQIKKDYHNFIIDPKLKRENHEYAVRMQLGFKKLLMEKGYSGFTAYFNVFKGDGRFRQIPMLAASNLMAEGYGYAAEGDSITCSLVAAGHVLQENAHFTEMYAMDFEKGSMLMSHMGEGNWKIAKKVELRDRVLGIGNLDNPPTTVFMAKPGEATLVSLVPLWGEKYRLVVSYGEILETEEIPFIEMPYFHYRPSTGVYECNNNWLRNGGTHHQVLHLGDLRRRWQFLCDILDIEYVEV